MKQKIILLNATQVTTKTNETKTIVNYVVLTEGNSKYLKGYPLNQKWIDGHIINDIDSSVFLKTMEVPLSNETTFRGDVIAVISNFNDLLCEVTAKQYRV